MNVIFETNYSFSITISPFPDTALNVITLSAFVKGKNGAGLFNTLNRGAIFGYINGNWPVVNSIIHPTIEAYNYAAGLAKMVGQNEKACDYKQWWATMMNPSENIDVFQKHEIADKFCKDLGVNRK